jgi:hypothetical protein
MEITIRWSHVAIFLAFALGLFVTLFALRLADSDASEQIQETSAIEEPAPSPVVVIAEPVPEQASQQVEAAPEPTATAEPIRSCDEIRASGTYRNEAERQAFLATCNALPSVTRSSPITPRPPAGLPTATPQSRPPPPFDRSIELIGAVWPDDLRPVPYCVNPANAPVGSSGQPILSPQQFASLVQAAFNTWQAIPESNISFAYQGLCQSDPWNNRDGVSTVGWGWLYGAAIGAADVGGTTGRFIRQNTLGQLYEVDILIDIRYAQSFDDPSLFIRMHLPHVLLHEVGHFIGLGHGTNRCSVMFPSGIGQGLCSVDIAAAAFLYPMP